jgi:hypothetical protein
MLKRHATQIVVGLTIALFLLGGSTLGPAATQVFTAAAHPALMHPYPFCLPPVPGCG